MLDDHTIKTVCKVISGLSTTRLRLGFDLIFKGCASFKLLPVDSTSLTFRKKIFGTDNHLTRLAKINKMKISK